MKRPNEKKQDLLLDALSCIDEDILERGLALRDGAAAPKTAEPAPKAPRPAAVIPPLYDLTRQPDKPPKKSPWRVISVVAAACLLLCVVPLSMWMVGSMTKNDAEAGETIFDLPGTHAGIQNGTSAEDFLPGAPGDGWGENDGPEAECPVDTEVFEESFEIMAPEGAETDGWQDPEADTEGVIFPTKPYSPEAWVWNTVSHTNGYAEKNIQVTLPGHPDRILNYSYTATVETFAGSQADQDAFRDQNVSPEDALVLDLFAQYCMSLYTMDYGSHFLLFHPAIVEERFTKEVAPHSYEAALGTINTLLGLMLPYDTVSADITLTGNYALTGDALDEYLADLRKRTESAGLSIENVTAARCFTAESILTVGGRFTPEEWGYGPDFYCFEYDGVWYLDGRDMDDDLCIDFALSGTIQGTGYLRPETYEGTVAVIEEGYLFMDDGTVFYTDAVISEQIAGHRLSVGDSVSIRHYDFRLAVSDEAYGAGILDGEGILYKAVQLTVIERDE